MCQFQCAKTCKRFSDIHGKTRFFAIAVLDFPESHSSCPTIVAELIPIISHGNPHGNLHKIVQFCPRYLLKTAEESHAAMLPRQ